MKRGTSFAISSKQLGLGRPLQARIAPRSWLHDLDLELPALAFMSVWQGLGLQLMVALAVRRPSQRDTLEAALLDGANDWQRTWHVTLPALRNTVVFVVSVTTIPSFRLFVQPYLMTRGGPDNMPRCP